MKKIIRKILKEDRKQMYLNKIIKFIKNDYPLIKNLKEYGFYEQLSEEELNYVFSGIFGEPVRYKYRRSHKNKIYNENGNVIYIEDSYGHWVKKEYDVNGNEIYREYENGLWMKWEYDENGNKIYREDSDGYWKKWEYDKYGNVIYNEDSEGYWEKYEYDENDNMIYHENSNGYIEDER